MRGRLRGVLATCRLLVLSLTGAAAQTVPDPALAKIASLRNQVETRRNATEAWFPSTLHQELFGTNRVRTGPESRAAILYSDQMLQRINENSELEILAPTPEKPGLLRLLFGGHYFSSCPGAFSE